MPIVVANTWQQELAAAKEQAMARIRAGATDVESEVWRIMDLDIRVRIRVRRGARGGHPTPHTHWYIAGRRKGWNALLGALRKREVELYAQT